MQSFKRLAAGVLTAALVAIPLTAVLVLSGCRKEEELVLDTNLSPNTRLTSAPLPASPENPPHSYRVHMHWDGSDPDGFVAAYYFAWDDTQPGPGAQNSPWVYTVKTDSLFKASIDVEGETERHTFYVRAVDNEGRLDPSPARIHFDASTRRPEMTSLYRVGGPFDPNIHPVPDPTAKDTVLMSLPCQFAWAGYDPDGLGAPVSYSYWLDANPPSPYSDATSAVQTGISSGTHLFYARARDETGAACFPASYKFVMNFSPDSRIVEPVDTSGTLTVADRETIWFRWEVRDKEQEEGLPGGVTTVIIEMDGEIRRIFQVGTPGYQEEFYFTSNTYPQSENEIVHRNNTTGGNRPHEFRVWARDVEGRFETPSNLEGDRERYVFSYNYPPTTVITYPSEGDTVCPDFTVTWEGSDPDGTTLEYQYVLDPNVSGYDETDQSSVSYTDRAPGLHEFRIRAKDQSRCWEEDYEIVHFWVEECK